jgi:hypothetical protein
MTGKPLSVTQKQVTAILKGAAKAGVKLEIKAVNGAVYFNVVDGDRDSDGQVRQEPDFSPAPFRRRPLRFDI